MRVVKTTLASSARPLLLLSFRSSFSPFIIANRMLVAGSHCTAPDAYPAFRWKVIREVGCGGSASGEMTPLPAMENSSAILSRASVARDWSWEAVMPVP